MATWFSRRLKVQPRRPVRPAAPRIRVETLEAREVPATSVFSFSAPTYSVGEAGGLLTVTVTRTISGTGNNVAKVDYATANGTAVDGADYTATSGTLTFGNNQTSKTFTVPVLNDATAEAIETFTLSLTPVEAGDSVDQGSATVTIADDDLATLSVSDVTRAEGQVGSTAFDFTVTLSSPSALPVTVDYATADGTATAADGDYLAGIGTLTFAPGETTKTVFVTVPADNATEGDETFLLNLTNPTNATLADGQGVGTIWNDDTAPVAAADAYEVDEDGTLIVSVAEGVLANDADAQAEPLTAILVDQPTHGALTLNPDGSFTYAPAADYNGTDSFTYQAGDGFLSSAVTTVTITITAVNDAPTAPDLSVSTNEDTTLPGTVSAGDTEADPLTYHLVGDVSHGSLTFNPDGSYTYTPEADFFGTDSFIYRATDGSLDSDVATVTITVNPVNDTPIASSGSLTTAEDTAATNTLAATDVDGPVLTHVLVDTANAHGTVTLTDPATGAFTYTPDADFHGTASFTFRANDGSLDSSEATVTITVTPVNDAPVAAGGLATTEEDTPLTGSVTVADIDGDAPTFAVVTGPSHGTLIAFDSATGTFTYVPDADYSGPDSFTFQANDGTADSNVATVSIAVASVNDAPVAQGDSLTTAEDTTLNGTVAATDVDGDGLTYSLVSGPAHGSLTFNPDGTFTYTPAANYHGSDSFTFQATDGTTDSNVATVSLTVTAVNDAPVLTGTAVLDAIAEATANPPGQIVSALFAGLIGDADGNALAGIAVVGNPRNAAQGTWQYSTDGGTTWHVIASVAEASALVLPADARLRFRPALGFAGDPAPLVVRAIDATYAGSFTVGSTPVTADVTTVGGATAFSADTAAVRAPVFDATGAWLSDTGDLFATGTAGNDVLVVRPAARGRVVVVLNGSVIGTFARADLTGRVRLRGLDGNDRLAVSVLLANPADLYGGAGNDTLFGGSRPDRLFGEAGNDQILGRGGSDALVGGDGNDTLGGGAGNDVLVGGAGADLVQGSIGSDLLIGGTTAFDLDPAGLSSIVAEWGSKTTYADRVAHLGGAAGGLNGTIVLTTATVQNDGVRDVLRGYNGLDWFWTGDLDGLLKGSVEVASTI